MSWDGGGDDVTHYPTATRESSVRVCVQKRVRGWGVGVGGGRHGAGVDYICIIIYSAVVLLDHVAGRWVGGLMLGRGIFLERGTRFADRACARCSSLLITVRCVFVARSRVKATAVCRRAPPNAYATPPSPATDRAVAARRNNIRRARETRLGHNIVFANPSQLPSFRHRSPSDGPLNGSP